ncbi:glycosyltransferase family 9 protein [Algihabitans albus]|uniref:glycosyltransferase family 9 protein n=1 Tax=Algihabitans albus TaxID=2164067 RepID=UPI0013C2DFFE|nr:glycosyltransferase family 9 protein [Algihabitans albus]
MRILVVLPTQLGDAVLAGGCLAQLLDRYPAARFTLVASRAVAPLYGAMPRLERIHLLEPQAKGRDWLTLWLRTVKTPWSLVADLRGAILRYFLPTRRRLAAGRGSPDRHLVTELAALLGAPPPERLRLWFAEAHHRAALRLLSDADTSGGSPVLAVGPTAEGAKATWPVERFAEAALTLTAPDGPLPGARIAVVAAKHERVLANPLLARLPRARRLDWVGRAPLPVLAAALQRCDLYLGNASGFLHLAAAAGCPTLGLLGPSDELRIAPWGPQTAVVRTPESRAGIDPAGAEEAMDGLEVGPVVEAGTDLLQRFQNVRKL